MRGGTPPSCDWASRSAGSALIRLQGSHLGDSEAVLVNALLSGKGLGSKFDASCLGLVVRVQVASGRLPSHDSLGFVPESGF
jgi:hypothetical protein